MPSSGKGLVLPSWLQVLHFHTLDGSMPAASTRVGYISAICINASVSPLRTRAALESVPLMNDGTLQDRKDKQLGIDVGLKKHEPDSAFKK